MSLDDALPAAQPAPAPGAPAATHAAVERVRAALAAAMHPHPPVWLPQSARTAQEAAMALGVSLGQIAKSLVWRRVQDGGALLVITAGDRRVDEHKLLECCGELSRADAAFVKSRTGFSIGGVSPLGWLPEPGVPAVRCVLDESLWRFDTLWAAAGHPNAVFQLSPQALARLTGAPWAEVAA